MVHLYYTKTKKVVPMERPSCFITSNLAVFITILFFLQYLTCCKGEMRYSIRQNKKETDSKSVSNFTFLTRRLCASQYLSDHIDTAIDFAIGSFNANHVDT